MAEIKILIKSDEMEEKEEVKDFIKTLNHEQKIYLEGFLNGIITNVKRKDNKRV